MPQFAGAFIEADKATKLIILKQFDAL